MKRIVMLYFVVFLLVSCKDTKTCPVCNGEGSVRINAIEEIECTICKGDGEVPAKDYEMIRNTWIKIRSGQFDSPNTGGMQQESQVQCPMCSGTGVFSGYGGSQTCSECKGSGVTSASRAAQLRQSLQQIDQMTGGGGYGGTSIDDGSYRPSERGSSSSGPDRSCHTCHGTGHCQHCKGTGLVVYDGEYNTEGGVMKCPICKGNGRCGVCYGRGEI